MASTTQRLTMAIAFIMETHSNIQFHKLNCGLVNGRPRCNKDMALRLWVCCHG